MRKTLLSVATATALAIGAGIATAQMATTTTWKNDYGTTIRQHSTTQSDKSFDDPALRPQIGMVLPDTVVVHPLPETVVVPRRESFSYGIIDNRPVIVERENRKVIHVYDRSATPSLA